MGVKTGRNPLRGIGLRAMSLEQLVAESAEKVPAGWQVQAVRPRTVDELERRGARRALITLCIGGGMGVATIIERV